MMISEERLDNINYSIGIKKADLGLLHCKRFDLLKSLKVTNRKIRLLEDSIGNLAVLPEKLEEEGII